MLWIYNTQISALYIYLQTQHFPIYIHRPYLNNSRQAIIVHSCQMEYMTTEINVAGAWISLQTQDFSFC